MKTYRQREKQGTKVADSSKGPDEAKIKVCLQKVSFLLFSVLQFFVCCFDYFLAWLTIPWV